jgi:NTP pyrophosphatase (non-canonical NTP hydrolase)
MEEAGELAQAIGKYRGMSGERAYPEEALVLRLILEELVDVAQTAVTMMYVLEREYDADIAAALGDHVEKMIQKGYMSPTDQPLRLIEDTE